MSPRKLTDSDKEELLIAYRETAETTSTLAVRYGVSSSTISRFLKSRLTNEEYEDLIQRKRLGRSNSVNKVEKVVEIEPPVAASESLKPRLIKQVAKVLPSVPIVEIEPVVVKPVVVEPVVVEPEIEVELELELESEDESSSRRVRKRSRRSPVVAENMPILVSTPKPILAETAIETPEPILEIILEVAEPPELEIPMPMPEVDTELFVLAQELDLGDRQQALNDLLGNDLEDDDYDDEDDDDEDDDDEDDDDEDDDDDGTGAEIILTQRVNRLEEIRVLPLEQARFPRTCYVITDRLSELVTRPMKDFRDLGHIPETEVSRKTLPVFDNHRIAKRFIHGRSQKVIKVPNSELFTKASNCLTAKGITRLLLDGNIYDLS